MSIRTIIGGIVGVIGALLVVIVIAVLGTKDKELAAASPNPNVEADREAPGLRNNPMTPVTEEEADRRAQLHDQVYRERSEFSTATMAPPVVTEVRSGNNANDPMAEELFPDIYTTPEPQPAPQVEVMPVEKEPEPEPVKVVEKEPEPEPEPKRLDTSGYRDRFKFDSGRGGSFGVRNLNEPLTGPMDFGAQIDPAVLGVDDMITSPVYARRSDDEWFEPYRVAGGYVQPIADPVVSAPPARVQIAPVGPLEPKGYSTPTEEQRSAARPAMIGVDQNGTPYTTSTERNPYLEALQGPIVAARSGDLIMAHLLYGFNSDDVRGLPIYATLSDFLPNGTYGPLNGARVQGQVAYSAHNASIIFDKIVLPNGREMGINAIAVAAEDARTGVAKNVNRHILSRYGALFLSGLIEGVGEVAQIRLQDDRQPVVIINEGDGTVNAGGRDDEPSEGEILAGAVAPIGRNMSNAAAQGFNRPPTISAPEGMPFALVFTATMVIDPSEDRRAFNPRTGQYEVVSEGQIPDSVANRPTAQQGQVGEQLPEDAWRMPPGQPTNSGQQLNQ